MTTEKFIQKAKEIYGDKFDYSKVEYKDSRTKVTIICPRCGEFTQMPGAHLKGEGCPVCNKSEKKLKEFIEKSRKVHGDKYDYSKSVYKGATEKIEVVCPIHGSFWIRASAHYAQGQGCPKCGREKANKAMTKTNEEFIEEARRIHGDYYDYSKVRYINYTSPIDIICPVHGLFSQAPREHLQGCGCSKCARIKIGDVADNESFIKKANIIHNNKYNYDKINYVNSKTKLIITCPIHGDFEQLAEAHLKGQGCPKCGTESNITKQTLSFGEVIDKCIDIYDNKYKYIYSKDSYVNTKSELEIICPEHGIFKISAHRHLHGTGCPQCQESFGETKVRTILEQSNCRYVYQAHFNFLDRLSYDFFLPDLNIAIEYQGKQHYEPVEIFGGEAAFIKQQERDSRKRKLSLENNIKLIEIRYDHEDEDLKDLENVINSQ